MSPDDLPPPRVPSAPEFDIAPPEPDLDLRFDAPATSAEPILADGPAPWYQRWPGAVAAAVVGIAVIALVLSWTSGPAPATQPVAVPVTPAAAPVATEPSTVVALADEVIGEQAPPPNVAVARPGFLPEGTAVVEVAGRQTTGTVTRPAGAWLRVTLEPGTYTFRVTASADTELHLNDVFNELTLNDDTDGLNPAITERLLGGDYYLWLHIHDEAVEETASFTLAIDGPN
jgi:hypothetical protein